MYVIFPADELIYMTYGVALPRIKPRPTLDNLREPLVPIGTRPSSLPPSRNVLNNSQVKPPTPLSNTTNIVHLSSRNQSIPREPSPSRFSIESQRTPKLNAETDEFGYASTHIDDSFYSSQPSITLDPPSPGGTTYADNLRTTRTAAPAAKPKHKLHLHLGRLGRSKQNQKPEPQRLRDVTEIRIANPTFTRENLQQRNYDAFFESGEPVYSLERRAPPQPSPEPEPPPLTASSDYRPHSLGFFNKSKATFALRSKSAEDTVEVPQKGDSSRKKQRA